MFYLLLISTLCMYACSASEDNPINPKLEEVIEEPIPLNNRPLLKDFIGLNGHFHFKPDLYKQVSKLVRIYHNLDWDVDKPGDEHYPPYAVNGVNWKENLYAPLKRAGFELDICLQIDPFNNEHSSHQELWKGKEQWEFDYGKTIASYYGPSGTERLATSIEIGNEPGNRFSKDLYKSIFKNMAQGAREGDPKLKIVTPYITPWKSNTYAQGLSGIYDQEDILPLYDVLNIHTYAMITTQESPFNRTYPEDPKTNYLTEVDETISWRDQYAPGKEIWITEFGYDAASPEAEANRSGESLKYNWRGYNDEQQAQYLIRSFFAFAERDVQRAYIFYYDDDDAPFIHSASGLTRKFIPKKSFWAVKQLYQELGDYRLNRIIKKLPQDVYVFELIHGQDPKQLVWVTWSPTGTQTHLKDQYKERTVEKTFEDLPALPLRIDKMATKDGKAEASKYTVINEHAIQLTVTESPQYIFFKLP